MPRCHNKVADGLADLTMDRRCSWRRRFSTTLNQTTANIIVQTDGGLRQGDCAAAAFIIGFWGRAGQGLTYEPWVVHGTFLESSRSAFAAEAIALDEASAELEKLLSAIV